MVFRIEHQQNDSRRAEYVALEALLEERLP